MAQMTDVPYDVLNVILIMLATSCNGAREVARVSATCKKLKVLTRKIDLLRVVNFQHLTLTNDYTMHHHINTLLCLCARAGNHAAHSILGKALLYNDTWFCDMIWSLNYEALNENVSSPGLLNHHGLVRSFIRHGSSKEIATMRQRLMRYMISFVGYDVARASGILCAITNMCFTEMNKDDNARNSIRALAYYCAELMPTHSGSYRDMVLVLFDRLFPSVPV